MNITRLQRVIVDALEDVKAQDIRVFNTQHLTALFDRVVIASGTSNRQTKSLAASVRDKVKKEGGAVISVEGEETGEWVLVDCGDAVVHIMQPTIRQYYQLEDLWGGKPVSLKLAEDTKSGRSASEPMSSAPAKKVVAKKVVAKKVAAKKAAAKTTSPRSPAAKTAAKKPAAKKAPAARKTAKKPSA
jgi:ribosome-associated protein